LDQLAVEAEIAARRVGMTLIYVLIFGSVAVFGLTAVAGLVWAARTGQFRDFAAGATSIFDEDEPIGVMTDGFPSRKSRRPATDGEEGQPT
jgi:nitrogen fixation-related uncharacterized protein